MAASLLLVAALEGGKRISPDPKYFRYSRVVAGATLTGRRVCAVLDASVMAHAKATLADLRLMVLTNEGPVEVPYALTISQTSGTGIDEAHILRRERSGARQVVELQMPARPYSEIQLQMVGQDFIGTAKVTGLRAPADRKGTPAGTFTLFDMTAQKLGRDTTLRLAEASFPVLRVEFESSAGIAPEVTLAEVPPSREAQVLYTPVAEAKVVQQGQEQLAKFNLPARVPVERVSFEVEPGENFSRVVKLKARAADEKGAATEEVAGSIARIRLARPGAQEIRVDNRGFAATLGANAKAASTVEVALENDGQSPLPIRAVRLEMRRREICFAAPREPLTLFYGDSDLVPPDDDYARKFQAAGKIELVGLGAEKRNPRFIGRDDSRSVTERHPELVWLILMGVVSIFGVVGFRASHSKA